MGGLAGLALALAIAAAVGVEPRGAGTVGTGVAWAGGCEGAGPQPPEPPVPCMEVPSCASGRLAHTTPFVVVTPDPTASPALVTAVSLCHTEGHLNVSWTLAGRAAPSNLTQCHDNVWQLDAAEFYLAASSPGARAPVNYTEIDHGPHPGAMWLGHIYNPTGYVPDPSSYANLPPCNSSGVTTRVDASAGGWSVQTLVPFGLVPGVDANAPPAVWRANLYRWAASPRQLTGWHNTSCDGHDQCNAPHVPRYFGVLVLV